MDVNFEQLITAFNVTSFSTNVLQPITAILEQQQQTDELLSSFVSQTYQSLIILEQKIWQLLTSNSHECFSQSFCLEFFQTFASFNKKIIFNQNNIEDKIKIALLLPETIDQINSIFQQIEQSNDADDPFITVVSYWFDNLTFFVHEYPRLGHLPIIIHIDQYFGQHFLMSEAFKSYFIELQQSPISSSIFTAKQLFYMKTCSFSLNVYFYTNPHSFDYTPNQILQHIGQEYLQMIQIHSYTVQSWSKELLACITHLIGFIRAFLWWNGEQGTRLKILLPTTKMLCEYIQAVIRIIDYKPFYTSIVAQWSNDETILMDSILLSLMNIVQTQKINRFFRSLTQLPDILLEVAELTAYFRIYLCAYGILSEMLTDEHLKELKFSDSTKMFFFDLLEQAWHDPSKHYKQIPIIYFLRGFSNLSKNDFIQQNTVKLNKIPLFIEISNEYPIAFDIIWGLSFNQHIQQQLRSSTSFMSKLSHLAKECNDEQMRKTIHGILWNLEINHQSRPNSDIINENSFDIMISYSHKDKELSKEIYDELTKAGYRVWIDFDQMRGNVMDAMAQAIEKSKTVIICMSEEYRKSNYCRAEAHYAFQRQRKIVPVLLQKHYKPDGWLLFLIGQLLYVDFNKHEFSRAMAMVFKEIKVEDTSEIMVTPVHYKKNVVVSPPPITSARSPTQASTTPTCSPNILEWTQTEVQEWLIEHNLIQMSRLLTHCDGRSLVYLGKYMKSCQSQQILNLLQEDSLRRTKQTISLIEISCFHSLMDQQKQLLQSTGRIVHIEKKDV